MEVVTKIQFSLDRYFGQSCLMCSCPKPANVLAKKRLNSRIFGLELAAIGSKAKEEMI